MLSRATRVVLEMGVAVVVWELSKAPRRRESILEVYIVVLSLGFVCSWIGFGMCWNEYELERCELERLFVVETCDGPSSSDLGRAL